MAVKRFDGTQWVNYAGAGLQGVQGTQGLQGPTGPQGVQGTAISSVSQQMWRYTATGGETSVSGTDGFSTTLAYTVGAEEVYVNGVLLERGVDYTASTGTSITGLTALVASDVVTVLSYNGFAVANAIPLSTVTAAGDLIVGTGASAVTRLGVGSSGTILTSNGTTPAYTSTITGTLNNGTLTGTLTAASTPGTSGQLLSSTGTGVQWVAAPSAGSNWALLNSGGTSLSGTVTTISGISGKDKLLVLIAGAGTNGTAGGVIGLQFNTDTGSNYYGAGGVVENIGTNGGSVAGTSYYSGTTTSFYLVKIGPSASAGASASAIITGGNSSGVKVISGTGGSGGSGQDYYPNRSYYLNGYYNSSSTISSVSVITGSSNAFNAGTVYVYASA